MADIASIAYVWVGSFFLVKWLFILATEVENSKLRSTDINENGDPKAAEYSFIEYLPCLLVQSKTKASYITCFVITP
jgi:hypothetical protein